MFWMFRLYFFAQQLPSGSFPNSPSIPPGGNELVWIDADPLKYPLYTISCYLHNFFLFPIKFFNYLFMGLTDMVLVIIPSTPEYLKIGSILNAVATENPLMWKLSGELISALFPMVSILVLVKLWKIYRPF